MRIAIYDQAAIESSAWKILTVFSTAKAGLQENEKGVILGKQCTVAFSYGVFSQR